MRRIGLQNISCWKKKLGFSIMLFLVSFCLSGCGNTPEFSSRYLLGASYGGTTYGDFYDQLDAYLIICTDGTVEVYMPKVVNEERIQDEMEYVTAITLQEEQYQAIAAAVDLEKLYKLDPKLDMDVCDGYSMHLTLYDENDQVLKECGGYMPQNKQFREMYDAVFDNLPMDELNEIRDESIWSLWQQQWGLTELEAEK